MGYESRSLSRTLLSLASYTPLGMHRGEVYGALNTMVDDSLNLIVRLPTLTLFMNVSDEPRNNGDNEE